MSDYLVAFDIGSSKVSAAMAKIDDLGKVHITAKTSVKCSGINKSVVVDLESTADAIKQCKDKLEVMTNESVKNVYVSFPANLCEIVDKSNSLEISTERSLITYEHIQKVMDDIKVYELTGDKEVIDIVPIKYSVDNMQVSKIPVGMKGRVLSVETQFYIVDRSIIIDYLKSIELVGLNIERIIVQPLAIAALTKEKDEINDCISIINVGADIIDISVYQGGGIYYSTIIPVGGNSITKDISMCFNVSLMEAEKIKYLYRDIDKNDDLNYDNEVEKDNIDFKMLDEIVKARVEEFIYLSFNKLSEFKFFEYINCIYIAGNGIFHYRDISEEYFKVLGKKIAFIDLDSESSDDSSYIVPVGIIKYINDSKLKKEKDNICEKQTKKNCKQSKDIMTKVKKFLRDFF